MTPNCVLQLSDSCTALYSHEQSSKTHGHQQSIIVIIASQSVVAHHVMYHIVESGKYNQPAKYSSRKCSIFCEEHG